MKRILGFSSKNLIRLVLLASVLLLANASVTDVRATALAYTNAAAASWGSSINWSPNSNWSTGTWKTNTVNSALRLNFGNSTAYTANALYSAAEGMTTIDVSSGVETRALVIGNGSGVNANLTVSGGSLVAIQSGTTTPVLVGTPGQTGTMTATLILSGGNLQITNGANASTMSVLFRGGATSKAAVIITNGSILAVDQVNIGDPSNQDNQWVLGAAGTINLGGSGSSGTILLRSIANGKAAFVKATNNFDGGILKVSGAEQSGRPLLGTNLVNNILAGGLTVDCQTYDARIVSGLMNGISGTDGGLIKLGSGTLSLSQSCTYNGTTTVRAGTLALGSSMTFAGGAVRVAAGSTLAINVSNNAISLSSLSCTNASLTFNYGVFSGYTNAVANVTTLDLNGTVTVNLSGAAFPVTNLTLLNFSSKTGSGSFTLGNLPSGAAATLTDTGSSLVLNITTASIQTLTWTGAADNIWQVNGQADWNPAGSTYLEYSSGTGDVVTFDDTFTGGTVSISGVVNPASITVNNTVNSYAFSGSGQIGGSTGIAKSGTNSLTISNSNSFTGAVTVTAGTLFVGHANALGATNAGTVVSGGGTVGLGSAGATTVSGESISISGAGVGGALGALRGCGTGPNVWAGPVVVAGQSARIGTEANGALTVSGNITDNGANYELFIRPGASGAVTISGTNNNFGSTRFFSDATAKATLKVGANNALSTNQLTMGPGYLDLNGYNQTVSGIVDVSGAGVITNNAASASVLTINGNSATNSTSSTIQDGSGQISVLKTGTGRQNLKGVNTYTGPTMVNAGELDVVLPMSSTALTIGSGAILSVTTSNRSWSVSAMSVTNANLVLNFGKISGTPQTPFNPTVLNVSGNNTINITATNLAIGQIVLISYGSKSGSGSFQLGTLPDNVQAALADTGSAIVLNVSFAPQTLTWSGGVTGSWNTNGTLDWSAGIAAYQEYAPGVGDVVVFDDSASTFSVIISNAVHPYMVTVSNNLNPYTIGGGGGIVGTNVVVKSGTNSLTFTNANSYSGNTTINAGTLFVNNSAGSGTGSGNVIVSSGATLRGSGTIGGSVTVNPGGTFGPGTASFSALTVSNSVSLSGTANFRINKSGLTLTNDAILGASSVAAGGQLTVTATGDVLAASDSFALFSRGVGAGWFTNVTLPTLAAGLSWDTNDLAVNGTLDVYTFTTMPLSVAVRTNIPALISAAKLANHLGSSRAAAGYPTGWTASVTTAPTNGITSLADGALTYTATAPNAVEDHFNITFGDGHGWQSMAVSVSIAAQNVSSTVASFTITPAGDFILLASGMPSTAYDIQAADSVSGPWATIGSATTASNGVLTFTDADAPNHSNRYYRLKQQ